MHLSVFYEDIHELATILHIGDDRRDGLLFYTTVHYKVVGR